MLHSWNRQFPSCSYTRRSIRTITITANYFQKHLFWAYFLLFMCHFIPNLNKTSEVFLFPCMSRQQHVRGGTQKFPGIVNEKICILKYSYKFETLVPFKVLRLSAKRLTFR